MHKRRRSEQDIRTLAAAARQGNRRAIARLLTIVEQGDDSAEIAIAAIYPYTGKAHLIGITGPPGAGKSSLVNALTIEYRKREQRVAIVAVDPSSPYSGGALLGDRVRMTDLYSDNGVFIRSMASRGNQGGLAQATHDLVKVFDAAGYERILIETVGAGQAEVEVASLAHSTVVVEAPGLGDDVQSIKAGILETADILVVNKSDRPGATNTVRALRNMLQLGRTNWAGHHGAQIRSSSEPAQDWDVPIVETVATDGSGVTAFVDALDMHRQFLQDSDGLLAREQQRGAADIEAKLLQLLQQNWRELISAETVNSMIEEVAARKMLPQEAARQLYKEITK